jgi:hypothetical protein
MIGFLVALLLCPGDLVCASTSGVSPSTVSAADVIAAVAIKSRRENFNHSSRQLESGPKEYQLLTLDARQQTLDVKQQTTDIRL